MIVIADVDNTISASYRREHLIEESWEAYHSDIPNDDPIPEMVLLVNALFDASHHIICLTGRPEKWRGLTMKWLIAHGVRFDQLWMRPNEDFRPGPIMKVELAKSKFAMPLKDAVGLVIDDVEKIAEAFRAEGVTTLLVTCRRDKYEECIDYGSLIRTRGGDSGPHGPPTAG